MSCTTILVGKDASYDGSTMIARNMDSGSGEYTLKKMISVSGKNPPKKYRSVLSHVEIPLPDKALDYICFPNALNDNGIWAGAGTNSANVSVSATETITSNELVLAADPLVVLHKQGRNSRRHRGRRYGKLTASLYPFRKRRSPSSRRALGKVRHL